MKANLPQTEPKLLARWEKEDLYGRIRKKSAGRPSYLLHDGPPYANGKIHLGTAFNKLLKDFIVKSKTMAGFDAPYVPGYDCHGLPIEFKVDQELGAKKATMSVAEIRVECRKRRSFTTHLARLTELLLARRNTCPWLDRAGCIAFTSRKRSRRVAGAR